MNIPRIPKGFLQHCVKYEYFKRNHTLQAHKNVCEMIDSDLTRNPMLQLPTMKAELEDFPGSSESPKRGGPAPKKTPKSPEGLDSEAGTPESPESLDSDSDDSVSIFCDEDPENVEESNGQCTMKRTKWLYERLAEKELEKYEKRRTNIDTKAIMELMSFRRIMFIPGLMSTLRPVRSVQVLVGYRKLLFKFFDFCKASSSIFYMSSREGCLVWYDNSVKVEETVKYQSLAAGNFSYLLNDKETVLEELILNCEPYRKCDPPIWPFSSFYRKIKNIWYRIKRGKIHIRLFAMNVFCDDDDVENGQFLVDIFWKRLSPEYLNNVNLKIWDASEMCKRRQMGRVGTENFLEYYYVHPLWERIKTLHIEDGGVVVNRSHFNYFFNFEKVYLMLPQDDFLYLVNAFETMEPVPTDFKCKFKLTKNFNFLRASEELQMKLFNEFKNIPEEGAKVEETFELKNGLKVTLEEKHLKIVFTTDAFKVPKQPAFKSPASKL